MKILVLEYITGGGLAGEALPDSLTREGDLMLQSLLNDLLELPEIELVVMRDRRLPAFEHSADTVLIEKPEEFESAWQAALSATDACWLIAPETEGVLERLTYQVEAKGVTLLGCSSAAVAISSSQSQSSRRVKKNAVPVINDFNCNNDMVEAWVVKPERGAGCENFQFFARQEQANDWITSQADSSRWIQQPWITGEPLSLCLLCKSDRAVVLSVNRQVFSQRETEDYSLQSCQVNVESIADEMVRFANKIVSAIPGLWGYVGVDLLRTSAGLVFVEINPRLTTSYTGLKRATGINPARQVLALLTNPLPSQSGDYNVHVTNVVVTDKSHVQ